MQESSLFSTLPPAFDICGLINDGHSDWYEVVSCGSFDLHFSDHQGCWAFFFMCLLAICISSLEKYLFRSFAHFSIGWLAFLLLGCISCLYILEIKPLSVASFETIFSHSESCLFVFFMVSFALQKLVSLIRFVYFRFYFLLLWETDLRKHLYDLCQRMFCLWSLLGVWWCPVVYLSLSAILSLFLCMV